ncbi:MAG: tetratricopeptide repeat protein [Verrucomicrobiaceae bacterium]|nr:tetratricopeptide repeat protein [Verrucomicrobiaceae bacterium]
MPARPFAVRSHLDRLLPATAALVLLAGGFLHARGLADMSPGDRAAPGSDLELSPRAIQHAQALAHYTTAQQLEVAGKLRDALEHYLAVFRIDPGNAELANHTAALAFRFQGRDAALKLLEDAVAASPANPQPLLNLARFASTYPPADGKEPYARAESALDTALTQFPRSAAVYDAAVLHYLTRAMRDRAIALMDRAAKLTVTDSQFWLDMAVTAERVWPLGQIEHRAAHLAKVGTFFDAALKHVTKQNAAQVKFEVARHYLLTNELGRSRTLCEQLVAENDDLQARKLLYRLYEAAGEPEKAFSMLEKIVAQDPSDSDHRRLLAQEYERREQPEKAIPQLEAAIQQSGGELGDYLKLAVQLGQTAKLDQMIRVGERALRLFPEQPNVHYLLAYAYYRSRMPAKAAPRFVEAERLASESNAELLSYTFYDQYGNVLEQLDRHDDAAAAWEKAITLCPPDQKDAAANLMNSLAYMWVEQGKKLDQATKLLTKAIELAPGNAAYIDSLGWLYFKKGDFKKALTELRRAEALLQPIEADDAEILEHIALTHQQLGDHPQALSYMERAHALQTPIPAIRDRITRELEKLRAARTEKK